MEEPECRVEPFATPPLPAESFALPGTHQVSPNLLLHPVFDHRKAPARVSHGKVVHPASQDRVDQFDHPAYGLAGQSSEDLPELCQQRRSFLELGGVIRSPPLVTAQDATERKAQEGKLLSLR